jgi:hypothetical protein
MAVEIAVWCSMCAQLFRKLDSHRGEHVEHTAQVPGSRHVGNWKSPEIAFAAISRYFS